MAETNLAWSHFIDNLFTRHCGYDSYKETHTVRPVHDTPYFKTLWHLSVSATCLIKLDIIKERALFPSMYIEIGRVVRVAKMIVFFK